MPRRLLVNDPNPADSREDISDHESDDDYPSDYYTNEDRPANRTAQEMVTAPAVIALSTATSSVNAVTGPHTNATFSKPVPIDTAPMTYISLSRSDKVRKELIRLDDCQDAYTFFPTLYALLELTTSVKRIDCMTLTLPDLGGPYTLRDDSPRSYRTIMDYAAQYLRNENGVRHAWALYSIHIEMHLRPDTGMGCGRGSFGTTSELGIGKHGLF